MKQHYHHVPSSGAPVKHSTQNLRRVNMDRPLHPGKGPKHDRGGHKDHVDHHQVVVHLRDEQLEGEHVQDSGYAQNGLQLGLAGEGTSVTAAFAGTGVTALESAIAAIDVAVIAAGPVMGTDGASPCSIESNGIAASTSCPTPSGPETRGGEVAGGTTATVADASGSEHDEATPAIGVAAPSSLPTEASSDSSASGTILPSIITNGFAAGTACSKSFGPEKQGNSAASEIWPSVGKTLEENTNAEGTSHKVSAEFRLQLQILERVNKQGRLLQELVDHQQTAGLQLEALTSWSKRLEQAAGQQLEAVTFHGNRQAQVCAHLQQVCERVEQKCRTMCDTNPRGAGTAALFEGRKPRLTPSSSFGVDGAKKPPRMTEAVDIESEIVPVTKVSSEHELENVSLEHELEKVSLEHELEKNILDELAEVGVTSHALSQTGNEFRGRLQMSTTSISLSEAPRYGVAEDNIFRKIVSSQLFDHVCAVVIIFNAATIGYTVDRNMKHSITHIGEGEIADAPIASHLGKFYIFFYTVELILKLGVYGLGFFLSKEWQWNVFDFVLVIVGAYDFISEMTDSNSSGNVTWLRLVRHFKMVKTLRMVRVMRFFRVLRMMVASIAGSMMILFWSILMVSLMMYIFGICFLMALMQHLQESTSVDEDAMVGIVQYWGGVPASVVTLFMAVTGGADWEPLADPLKQAGAGYYFLFMFYIAFSAFAVLNVLTGMFVETAMKVSQDDEEAVGFELLNREETHQFRAFLHELTTDATEETHQQKISWKAIRKNADADQVKRFIRMVEIDMEDLRRVYSLLDFDMSKVVIEDYIHGLIHAKEGAATIDIVNLTYETKRMMELLTQLTAFLLPRKTFSDKDSLGSSALLQS
eukprot:TRINITY_DN5585_c0_g1_i2.p1 TRINITY_DN5585_c0_g1~~TRINITY_DN5585_c0_g1_i2.p1  ORF type:complete len:871 (-),score=169.57 TRINITY_DN5585_c0_g1_i2:83-2695(-)